MTDRLQPPCGYQGGKSRLAAAIVDHMQVDPEAPYTELCCGSAAVALELLNRGHRGPVTLVDAGPWGMFWREVGAGTFDIAALRRHLAGFPADVRRHVAHLTALAARPAAVDTTAVFLVLQAGSFGGNAIRLHWKLEDMRHRLGDVPMTVNGPYRTPARNRPTREN